MGPRRVIEGQAAEVKRRERWEAAVKRRKSSRRNVGLLAVDTQRPSQTQWWSFPSTLRSQILQYLFKDGQTDRHSS